MKLPELGSGGRTVALCERCGEEIAVANDLDRAADVDRRRHLVMVAGRRRSLTATHWQIFMPLYRYSEELQDAFDARQLQMLYRLLLDFTDHVRWKGVDPAELWHRVCSVDDAGKR